MITCNFNMFMWSQRIYYNDMLIGITSFDCLGEKIVDACDRYGVNKVHLIGNEDYASKIIQDIQSYDTKKNIEIEVN